MLYMALISKSTFTHADTHKAKKRNSSSMVNHALTSEYEANLAEAEI